MEIKIITFVIELRVKSIVALYNEGQVQVMVSLIKFLKIIQHICHHFFEELLNLSIETNTFPDDFKVGKVAPVFKSGGKEDLNNYIPISVLPNIARFFERLLYNQLYDYLTANKLSEDEQYELRSLHSTAMALGKMSSQWLI